MNWTKPNLNPKRSIKVLIHPNGSETTSIDETISIGEERRASLFCCFCWLRYILFKSYFERCSFHDHHCYFLFYHHHRIYVRGTATVILLHQAVRFSCSSIFVFSIRRDLIQKYLKFNTLLLGINLIKS